MSVVGGYLFCLEFLFFVWIFEFLFVFGVEIVLGMWEFGVFVCVYVCGGSDVFGCV